VTEPQIAAQPALSPGAQAWNLMYDLFKVSKPFLEVVSAEFEMTPQQVYALRQLGDSRPMAMSELATLLGCDASNVPSIVDKLESRGLVERRSADHDRRVKSLSVTPSGAALHTRIMERMQQPPPAIDNLTTEDQAALCVLLQRALDSL
jgi:DNA-binding MarR family transcriptional regulator